MTLQTNPGPEANKPETRSSPWLGLSCRTLSPSLALATSPRFELWPPFSPEALASFFLETRPCPQPCPIGSTGGDSGQQLHLHTSPPQAPTGPEASVLENGELGESLPHSDPSWPPGCQSSPSHPSQLSWCWIPKSHRALHPTPPKCKAGHLPANSSGLCSTSVFCLLAAAAGACLHR